MFFTEYIFAYRDWSRDAKFIPRALAELKQFPDPIWMVVFPEGTRFTPAKLAKSNEFARANNKPTFNHVLLPRTKASASPDLLLDYS